MHVGALVTCTHAAPALLTSTNVQVLVSGLPLVTMADIAAIAGCAFVVGVVPHPCVRVQWLEPSTQILINGQPAVIGPLGMGLGPDQAPQGPVIVGYVQPQVIGL